MDKEFTDGCSGQVEYKLYNVLLVLYTLVVRQVLTNPASTF